MWTYLCNFFSEKLFHKPDVSAQLGRDDCLFGKRIKLSNNHLDSNVLSNRENSRLVSMQKENINGNDDEEECCVIAEIPRRKKPGNSSNIIKTPLFSYPIDDQTKLTSKSSTNLSLNKQDDKEAQMLQFTRNSWNRIRPIKPSLTKSHRFFNSPRTSLAQSKILRYRLSFKNNMKRNMSFLKESYRLTEKYQYIQLLQSHTTYNLLTVKPKIKEITYKPKEIPVIDLTVDVADEKIESDSDNKSSEDQEVQIVDEISGVRSFQDILKITPVDTKDVVKRILSRRSIHASEPLDSDSSKENALSLLDDDNDSDENQKTSPEDLEEKIRAFMKITGSKIQEPRKSEHYSLPKITHEQEEKIKRALEYSSSHEYLAEGFGLKITRRDMQTLVGLNWLNDEVINFYMNLIMDRSKLNKVLPKVYAFNTFFYPKLVSSGYVSLRRWTKQVDIFSYDIILVPIHLGMHWCMAVIDFRAKAVRYYDSVGSPNDSCLDKLMVYLKAESLDKKKKIFPTSNWEKTNVEDVPQQMNGSDCGVFSCMFAEHIGRDCGIFFSQDDMPYFRKKMIIEILDKKLLT